MPSLGSTQQGSRINEIKKTFTNAIALVRNPVGYMTANKSQTVSINSLMVNYVAILALVPLVGRLIGDILYYDKSGYHVADAVAGTIVAYFLDIISVFIVGYVIWWLAPRFKTATNREQTTMLAAFIYTPVFLIGILSIIPVLGYLAILGLLYGLYILYKGLGVMLGTPSDQTLMYVIFILVVTFIIEIVISLILGALDGAAHVMVIGSLLS